MQISWLIIIATFGIVWSISSYYNNKSYEKYNQILIDLDKKLPKNMASSASLPNEYFRFTMLDSINHLINQARDDVLGPLESRKKLIGTDTHITVYFIGNKLHINPDQLSLLRCFKPLLSIPIKWKIAGISVGDISPVVMLDLDFASPADQQMYQSLYESLYGVLRFWGFENAMNLASPKQHPKCHITLSWANDRDHAFELLEKFKANINIQKMLNCDDTIRSKDFELFHNDGECIENYTNFRPGDRVQDD